ncbi:uncharacterized oxidoreductase TM_0325-like [Oppia nitens]|uniref:uncharacterized oxidoreductase TM_0325-like n=1 Tax=Oppia nitens TaxID=1686743 RepID=UPI0023DBD2E3|nr:uncharacterized oxidoreductase TM_0325-like [Oppia nitens]
MSFYRKVVLVTGSSSGIGAVIAIHFSQLGANVVVTGRNICRIRRVAQQCRYVATRCAEVIEVVADLTKDCECRRLIRRTIEEFGQLDVLINNANVSGMSKVDDPKSAYIFDHIMHVNVRSTFLLSQLSIPHLELTNGCIVNISSRAASNPVTDYSLYCMSKASLDMMTKCLALDLKHKGIRVNAVNPSFLRPKVSRSVCCEEDKSEDDKLLHYPLKRLGEPQEIARTVEFLASGRATHITGVTTAIDGDSLLSPFAIQSNKQ